MKNSKTVRVLYSYPFKLGADRICHTAWQQVRSLSAAGAEIQVFPGVLQKSLPTRIKVSPTLSWGKLRISYKLIGSMQACALHDYIVSRRIEKMKGKIDIIHTWPMGALRTLKTAARLGISTVLERPNAHTRFAYEVVQKECKKLGVSLPSNHEHAFKHNVLRREEAEYKLPKRLLCPSDFVIQTFIEKGFHRERLIRHQYGFDEKRFYPDNRAREKKKGLVLLFVGEAAVRKGLHYALEAWFKSPAHYDGNFMIAGDFVPSYYTKLSSMLSHPSIHVLGHRKDVPELMRKSDILILPSIEEGSALVTSEGRGSGCVLLVSNASGANCKHMENGLVHSVGDIETLSNHITMLHKDRTLLESMRAESLRGISEITWDAAGVKLLQAYKSIIEDKS